MQDWRRCSSGKPVRRAQQSGWRRPLNVCFQAPARSRFTMSETGISLPTEPRRLLRVPHRALPTV